MEYLYLLAFACLCFTVMFCSFLDYCKDGLNNWLTAKADERKKLNLFCDGYERGYKEGFDNGYRIGQRLGN